MSSLPRVTVVIPTYNRRGIVMEAVESVLAQTVDELELLVVDDGSTDGTAEMIEAAHSSEPRLSVVRQANGGTSVARNTGVRKARAAFVAYLDSDDLWEPDCLASQLAVADREEADLVIGNARYDGASTRAETLLADPDFQLPATMDAMLDGAWALPTTWLLRTEVARALPFNPELRYAEDTEFLYRFNAEGRRCVLNPDRVAVWRDPGGGAGEERKTTQAAAHELVHLSLLREYGHRGSDGAAVRLRTYHLSRRIAKLLIEDGLWAEARPFIEVWARHRPWRPGVWLRLWKSVRSTPG
jgi:glycosyltransferase involved in cell wall biosynthesis